MPNSCSRWPNSTVFDQKSAETGQTDSEMFIADVVDEDCDSDTSSPNPHMLRGDEDSAKRLSSVAPFTERNPDKVASTLEWRERVLHSQEASQATTSSSRQWQTAEEHEGTSLEIEIERIRRHYQKQEMVLEGEIVKLEQRYKSDMELLKKEENDEEDHSAAEWWEVQEDYQPTECGSDGGRYLMPEREHKQ